MNRTTSALGPRSPAAAASAYGVGARLLHRVVLGNRLLGELLLDLDAGFAGTDPDQVRSGRHLFIAGLPRCGSSALLRRLHATGAFVSLTYRDMPFVLAPALWQALARALPQGRKAAMVPRPRAHDDGLTHDYDTPEAFEEVFWRSIDGAAYRRGQQLLPHQPGAAVTTAFLRYIGAVLTSRRARDGRYLSKNNGNILRLPALRRLLPDSLLLVPFRDPLQQAHSLWRQHRRASEAAQAEPFVGRYLDWLGHNTFGSVRRGYALGGPANPHPPDALAHWLWLWNSVYRWLLSTAPDDALFIGYESLCREQAPWARLVALAELPSDGIEVPLIAATEADQPAPAGLLAMCLDTHAALRARQQRSPLGCGCPLGNVTRGLQPVGVPPTSGSSGRSGAAGAADHDPRWSS